MRAWPVLLLLPLAGCVDDGGSTTAAVDPTVDRAALMAEALTVESLPGGWSIYRLVLDETMWSWSERDRDSARADLYYAMNIESDAPWYMMFAVRFAPVFSEENDREPIYSFMPADEDQTWFGYIGTAAGGDDIPDQPPRHELAWLVGSHHAAVRLQVALLEEFDPRDDPFDGRPAFRVEPDAQGSDGFAGLVLHERTTFGRDEQILGTNVTFEESLGPAGATTMQTLSGSYQTRGPGVMATWARAGDVVGVDTWDFTASNGRESMAYEAMNIGPGLIEAPEYGLARPVAMLMGPADGALGATLRREHTGPAVSDSTWMTMGFADVDLEGLYGWPLSTRGHPVAPGESAAAWCMPALLTDCLYFA